LGPTPRTRRSLRICAAAAALSIASFAFGSGPAAAQVRINEIFPNPAGTETGFDEVVELYNPGPNPVDMTGWAIDDAVTIGQVATRARIPEDLIGPCATSAVIGVGEYRLVRGQSATAWLNNTGDDVYLVSSRVMAPTVIHLVTYPSASLESGNVWSCIPNGTSSFAWRTPTLCASNGAAGDITAPGTVSDLLAVPGAFPGEIRLTWTAPGDDGGSGTASAYIMKVSSTSISAGTFDASADIDRWTIEPLPLAGGVAETLFVFGLDPDSTWCFALKAQDEVPNTSAISNSSCSSPTAGTALNPDLGYEHFYGNLHSHTSYSDGVQTPAQAFTYARTGAPTPLDFLAVTDHNHSGAGMSLPNYALGMAQAASANDDGNFVAIWGQEWGIIATGGHANVFEAPVLFGWEGGNYDVFVAEGDYTGLYSAYVANPPSAYPPIVGWNHPVGGDFNDFALTPDSRSVVHLLSMISGPAFSTSTTESDVGSTTGNEVLWQAALRDSHRVSPTGDQDNHEATWGASTETRTVALAAGLTKSQILTSLAARRAYATQDHNIQVDFTADGHAMGEAWTAASGIRIVASISDPDPGDQVTQIDLMRGVTGSSTAVLVASNTGSSEFSWRELDTFTPGTEVHYYLRIRQSDNAITWTGPVYVTYDPSATTAVGDRPATSGLQLAVGPNPWLDRVTASFSLPQGARDAGLAVYDAAGRNVATLLDGPLSAGPHAVSWTGLDARGQRVPSGIYFMRLRVDGSSVVRKALLVR
jgi:hypothetical protein